MRYSFVLLILFVFFGCTDKGDHAEPNYDVIPRMPILEKSDGWFTFQRPEDLKNIDGLNISEEEESLSPGYYSLKIDSTGIDVEASDKAGVQHALTTLQQLIDLNNVPGSNKVSVPYLSTLDGPRFSYRGMHLDVARHFFPVEVVKEYIDLLAYYKLNRFHWHLTEDQGWRIEIKQYPKLQEIAAYRPETLIGSYSDQPHKFDGKRYGGYYTQEEIKDVVAYASEKNVTIIPEIEMPGHAQAAIAAYPELGCTGEQLQPMTKWGVSENVYCPTEETFEFLENVLDEVMELFPSKYIHIGGDEVPKKQWKESEFCQNLIKEKGLKDEHELQSYFIQRIEKYLNSKGRQIIGWDEILEGGLAPNATVMSWRGMKGGIEAAEQGHDVIMTPTSHCYFDYYQSIDDGEPLAIGGYLPVEKVYSFDPVPESLEEEKRKHILGAQGNVWTEYIPTREKLFYMALPRMQAIAEVNWTPTEEKNYKDFVRRLGSHFTILEQKNIKPANHVYNVNASFKVGEKGVVILENPIGEGEIRYSFNGEPEEVYTSPVSLDGQNELSAQLYINGEAMGKKYILRYNDHLAASMPIELKDPPHPSYNSGGKMALVNGIKGSDEKYGDREWLGFSGKDFDATIDLLNEKKVNLVSLRFFNGPGQWIYLPKKASVYLSENGSDFVLATQPAVIKKDTDERTVSLEIKFPSQNARYVRVIVERHGIIADGLQGAGNEAWLFVDEVVVH